MAIELESEQEKFFGVILEFMISNISCQGEFSKMKDKVAMNDCNPFSTRQEYFLQDEIFLKPSIVLSTIDAI